MFTHSDRMPTGTPLPQGAITPVPWGVQRMAPYPGYVADYAQTVLDPETQAAVYLDAAGNVMEAPGHGTSTGTNPPTATGNPSDGQQGSGDSDTGNDTDQ